MTQSTEKHLFCYGFGYSCDYLSHALLDQPNQNWKISGTTRDPEKQELLKERGINAHIFKPNCPLTDPVFLMRDVTHLLISTPPGDAGDPTFLSYADDIAQIPNLEWVGYLSTTGVYGNRDGGEVDETSELRPSSKRGSRRVKAEEQWLSLFKSKQLPVHIFRLSGIYGPGRSALDSVRAGLARRIFKENHQFGRIHVEDIAQILIASMENPAPGEVYNVNDGHPAPSHDVIEHACTLLKRPVPPLVNFEQANLPPMARSFYMDNRIMTNKKISEELGITLKYPSYKEGLQGCLDAEEYAISLFKQA